MGLVDVSRAAMNESLSSRLQPSVTRSARQNLFCSGKPRWSSKPRMLPRIPSVTTAILRQNRVVLRVTAPSLQVAAFSTSAPNAFGLRPKRVSSSGSPTLLEASRAAALTRRQLPRRTGALAFKKGMTAIYNPDGVRVPCTVLLLDRVQVTAVKDRKRHGYWAVQVGLGWRNPKNITRPMLGHFERGGVAPKKLLREFRVADESGLLDPGTLITADHFSVGQFVDVRADSKGKGFAGVCSPLRTGAAACLTKL